MIAPLLDRYRSAYSGLPREVWLLSVALLVNRAGAMVLAFLTIYLTSERSLSAGSAGRMLGVYGLGAVLGAWLGGRLTDRVGAIRLQTICLFLTAPGFLLIPCFTSPTAIAAVVFYVGVMAEAVRPANAAAVTRLTTSQNRTRAFALVRLAVNLGCSVGPAVGGFLASVDFVLLFVVDAITTLMAGVVLLVAFGIRKTNDQFSNTPKRTVVSPLRDRVFVRFSLLMLLTGIVFFQLGSTYPLYLRDHYQMANWHIGLMFAVNTVVIVFCEMLLVDHVKSWPSVRTIAVGAWLACIGMGILPFGTSVTFCVFAMLVLTLGEMLAFPLAAAFVGNRSAPGAEGRYMGWYTMVFSLSALLGPTLGATVYELSPDGLWYLCLATSVLVAGGLYALSAVVTDSAQPSIRAESKDADRAAPPE